MERRRQDRENRTASAEGSGFLIEAAAECGLQALPRCGDQLPEPSKVAAGAPDSPLNWPLSCG